MKQIRKLAVILAILLLFTACENDAGLRGRGPIKSSGSESGDPVDTGKPETDVIMTDNGGVDVPVTDLIMTDDGGVWPTETDDVVGTDDSNQTDTPVNTEVSPSTDDSTATTDAGTVTTDGSEVATEGASVATDDASVTAEPPVVSSTPTAALIPTSKVTETVTKAPTKAPTSTPKPTATKAPTSTPKPTATKAPTATPTLAAAAWNIKDHMDEATALVDKNWGTYQEVLKLVNELRAEVGAEPLELNRTYCIAATLRSMEQYYITGMSHYRPNGESCFSIADEMSLPGFFGGENVAWGYGSASAVVSGWRGSEGHYQNMINSSYKYLGVGLIGTNWTQMFGMEW